MNKYQNNIKYFNISIGENLTSFEKTQTRTEGGGYWIKLKILN